jgi:hypothetical protein
VAAGETRGSVSDFAAIERWRAVGATVWRRSVRHGKGFGAFIDFQMVGKWLEILKEATPALSRAALMFNPDTSPHYYVYLRSFEAVPRSIALEVAAAPVRDTTEVEEAFAKLGRDPGAGLIVPPDAFTLVHHQLFIRLAQPRRSALLGGLIHTRRHPAADARADGVRPVGPSRLGLAARRLRPDVLLPPERGPSARLELSTRGDGWLNLSTRAGDGRFRRRQRRN